MAEPQEIPSIVLEAYSLLLQRRTVAVTKALCWSKVDGKPGLVFCCTIDSPQPNSQGVPSQVAFRVLIPDLFPYAPVSFYSESEQVRGFPHQDAETGKLCLCREDLAPRDARRLYVYTDWASQWVHDAATGTLLAHGDPYELSDFSRKLLKKKLPSDLPIFFCETPASYRQWQARIGESGDVWLMKGRRSKGVFAARFLTAGRQTIWETPLDETMLERGTPLVGRWILLSDIRIERHRPAQTYGELRQLCERDGVDLGANLRRAWEGDNTDPRTAVVLVGFPIPRVVGDAPCEVHWQPLLFDTSQTDVKNSKKLRGTKKRGPVWESLQRDSFGDGVQIPWGEATNVASERLCARGAYSSAFRSTRLAVFGCGALGSAIGEMLARGGVASLSLFDRDVFEPENQCRHTLDGGAFGRNKAIALAERLAASNPLLRFRGYSCRVPPDVVQDKDAVSAIKEADWLLDCTTSDTAFDWLDHYASEHRKRFVTLFFSWRAEILTICMSGGNAPCSKVVSCLYEDVRVGNTPIPASEYFRHPDSTDQVMPGAGCWHPTFPAMLGHVWLLAATALDVIDAHLQSPESDAGLAVLIRRNTIMAGSVDPRPLVELLWSRYYR